MTPQQLIRKWRISHAKIAEHMGMPLGTFKTKLSENQDKYRFTPDEQSALLKALKSLGADIKQLKK